MPKESEDENAKKYRASTLGCTLAEALQSLVVEGQITKREAQTIMGHFDDVSPPFLCSRRARIQPS